MKQKSKAGKILESLGKSKAAKILESLQTKQRKSKDSE